MASCVIQSIKRQVLGLNPRQVPVTGGVVHVVIYVIDAAVVAEAAAATQLLVVGPARTQQLSKLI